MQDDGVAEGDVRVSEEEVRVLGTRVRSVPDVQGVGRAVEIRGEAAQLVLEILGEWFDSQNRRISFLRRDGTGDSDTRRQIRGIVYRTQVVYRVMRAWEGVLSVPQEDSRLESREN